MTPPPLWSVPVLMYHEIRESAKATWPRLAVSPDALRTQLAYLSDAGYTTLTASALASLLAKGSQVPPRSIVLTFDDGFEDFHRHALPLIAEHHFTATVFVTTGWIQDAKSESAAKRPGPMLSWAQAAEAVSAGIEIGAHSCQHPQLDRLPATQVRNELYASKAELEDRLAIPVPGLAYPYGYSNARVREVAQAVGYDSGYAVRNTMTSTGTDLFRLPRLTVHNSTRMSEFRRLAEGRLAPTMLRDRALTACWSVVRQSKAALTGGRDRLGYIGSQS